eukprot:TRINITY_DN15589_c0_g1_i1.p1 TRINITY_DN15589_c0_g1~~TRINITY_DN15589_c0_g1_i1.p1  ORF type:complete len:124 (+),score=28.38 TRINITY_DN15589_c0_g1_i1:1094-1465(+)
MCNKLTGEQRIYYDHLDEVHEKNEQNDLIDTRTPVPQPARETSIDPTDPIGGWEVLSVVPLLDWILENYKNFGSVVHLVSGKSSVGHQFVEGFGGVGAMLRYPIEFPCTEQQDEEDDEEFQYF